MNDIIEQLNEMISVEADGSPKTPILQAAVDEIVRLRDVAGAVSDGPSHREIKAKASKPAR